MYKKLSLIFVFLLSFILFNNQVFAATSNNVVLFINQVRGEECCQKGNLISIKNQVDTFKKNNLSANFNLRYDALNNPEYINYFKTLNKNQFEIGGFLEITPSLAKDSGVKYTAKDNNWSQAHNAYTLGYAPEDRKKIIDVYMGKFLSVFGYYPKTTTAWIMDTDSLSYLQSKYGVKSHQITREQWGTDSYTLSGGPVHYPYFASSNWVFLPTNQDSFNNKLLILRQTGSDPLHNYGDTTNAFTTQPNDYALDGKDISYFKKLSNELLFEQNNNFGFLLLGIENSMAQNYQDDYIEQINIIANLNNVKSFTVTDFRKEYSKDIISSKVVTVAGSDLVNGTKTKSLWINTSNYRARLLFINDQIKLTDLRIYDQNNEDPYNSIIAKKYAYWIVPFIFDGSRFYEKKEIVFTDFMSRLRQKYLPELNKDNFELRTVHKDLISNPDGLIFNIKKDSEYIIHQDEESVAIKYVSPENINETISFYTDYFVAPKVDDKNFNIKSSYFLNENINGLDVLLDDKSYYGLQKNCSDKCIFSFSDLDNDTFSELRDKYYYLFYPEIRQRDVSTDNSIFYAHNKYTIQDKNPVRFVFMPRDIMGLPTIPTGELKINFSPEINRTFMHEAEGNGTQFFDVYSNGIGKYLVNFSIDNIKKTEEIFFAPDCKDQVLYCLTHPSQASWYFKSMFFTKLRNF